MLQSKLLQLPFAIILAFAVIITGCDLGSGGNTGTMTVLMHDAPIESAEAVNVYIERIEVNNLDDEEGWTVLGEPRQSFDLLKLTNGALAALGSSGLPTGHYEQIRLVLGDDGHSIVIDETEYDLVIPSGAQTGVKLNIDAEIQEGIEYVILLDFDAARSVVEAGDNNPALEYLLQPVVRATNQAITGNIGGTVDPAGAEAQVHAVAGQDTVSSTIADTGDGSFLLVGLEEGSYDVAIDPRNGDYQSERISEVAVTIGDTNNLGTVEVNGN